MFDKETKRIWARAAAMLDALELDESTDEATRKAYVRICARRSISFSKIQGAETELLETWEATLVSDGIPREIAQRICKKRTSMREASSSTERPRKKRKEAKECDEDGDDAGADHSCSGEGAPGTSSPAKVGTKCKRVKGTSGTPQKPKRGASPFLCFLQPKCTELKQRSPGLSHKDAVSQASKMWNEMDEATKMQYVEQARVLKEALQDQFRAAELARGVGGDACDGQVSFHAVLDTPFRQELDDEHIGACHVKAESAKPKRPQPKECTNCHLLVSPNNYTKHWKKCITTEKAELWPMKLGEPTRPLTTHQLAGTELFLWDDVHGWCPGRVESVNGLVCSVRAQGSDGLDFVEAVTLPEHNVHWKAFCVVAGGELSTTIRVVRYGDGSPGPDGPPAGTSIYVKFGKGPAKKWWHAKVVPETDAPKKVLARRKAGAQLVEFSEDGAFAWVLNKDVVLHDPAVLGAPKQERGLPTSVQVKTLVADTDEAKCVGDRIAVQWLLDKRAYTGTVTKRDFSGTRVLVAYDDGEKHWAEWEGGQWVDTAEVSGDDEPDEGLGANLLPSVLPNGPTNPPSTGHGHYMGATNGLPKLGFGTGRSTVVTTKSEPSTSKPLVGSDASP